jgi:cytochrome c
MDSWTFNKISGAVLGTALLVFGLKEVSGAVYHTDAVNPEKPGFLIEVAEHGAEGGHGGGEAEAAKPIGVLLATADAAKGATEAKACAACHDFAEGGKNKSGPALWDVVERKIGSAPGFSYSAGIGEKSAENWTYDNLNAFLTNPKGFIKGTKMSYGGQKNDEKRADLIAYLASLSKAPKPFPAP